MLFIPMQSKSGLLPPYAAVNDALQHFSVHLGAQGRHVVPVSWTCRVTCDPHTHACRGNPKVLGGLKGVNYGGRFIPEHFLGLPGSDVYLFRKDDKPKQAHEMSICDLDEASGRGAMARFLDENVKVEHFHKMAELGFNIVRLPLGYWNLIDLPNGETPDGPQEAKKRWSNLQKLMPAQAYRKWIDMIFEFARGAGLKIMLDLHSAPGMQSGNECTGCDQGLGPRFYLFGPNGQASRNEDLAVEAIEVMAKLCANKGDTCYGMELLNEPYGNTLHTDDLVTDVEKCAKKGMESCAGLRLFFTADQLSNPDALVSELKLRARAKHNPGQSFAGQKLPDLVLNTSRQALKRFYTKAMERARLHLDHDRPLVIMEWPSWLEWWKENADFNYQAHGKVAFSTHIYAFPYPWTRTLPAAQASFQRDLEKMRAFAMHSGYRIMVSEFSLNSHGNGGKNDWFDYNALAAWSVQEFERYGLGWMVWNYDSFWAAWGSVAKQQVGHFLVDWKKINGRAA